MPSPTNPNLLNVTEAAAYLRLSVSYMNAMSGMGMGPMRTKIGKRVYYQRAVLDEYIAAHTAPTPPIPKKPRAPRVKKVKVKEAKALGGSWIVYPTDDNY